MKFCKRIMQGFKDHSQKQPEEDPPPYPGERSEEQRPTIGSQGIPLEAEKFLMELIHKASSTSIEPEIGPFCKANPFIDMLAVSCSIRNVNRIAGILMLRLSIGDLADAASQDCKRATEKAEQKILDIFRATLSPFSDFAGLERFNPADLLYSSAWHIATYIEVYVREKFRGGRNKERQDRRAARAAGRMGRFLLRTVADIVGEDPVYGEPTAGESSE